MSWTIQTPSRNNIRNAAVRGASSAALWALSVLLIASSLWACTAGDDDPTVSEVLDVAAPTSETERSSLVGDTQSAESLSASAEDACSLDACMVMPYIPSSEATASQSAHRDHDRDPGILSERAAIEDMASSAAPEVAHRSAREWRHHDVQRYLEGEVPGQYGLVASAPAAVGSPAAYTDSAQRGDRVRLSTRGKSNPGSANRFPEAGDVLREAAHGTAGVAKIDRDDGLDAWQIRRVVERHESKVRTCYEDGLKRDQHLSGRVEFAWEIDRHGQVSDASVVASTLDDQAVESCIRDVLIDLQFPPRRSREGISATYPFVFAARLERT